MSWSISAVGTAEEVVREFEAKAEAQTQYGTGRTKGVIAGHVPAVREQLSGQVEGSEPKCKFIVRSFGHVNDDGSGNQKLEIEPIF